MKTKSVTVVALVCSLFLQSGFAVAAGQATEQTRMQAQEQEHIYGSQMMTEQERNEYRLKMHAAKTNEEREQVRMEHHERMTKRAKAQGLSLPDAPAPRGLGLRPSKGMGGVYGGGKGGGKNKD